MKWIKKFNESLKLTGESMSYQAFDDNNGNVKVNEENYTSFGAIFTMCNIFFGVNEPYYKRFAGLKSIKEKTLEVTNRESFIERFPNVKSYIGKLFDFYAEGDSKILVKFSYNYYTYLFAFSENFVETLFINKQNKDVTHAYTRVSELKDSHIYDYAIKSNSFFYDPIKVAVGLKTIEEVKSNDKFIGMVDEEWMMFSKNDSYYLCLRVPKDEFQYPIKFFDKSPAVPNPWFFYIDKKTGRIFNEERFSNIKNIAKLAMKVDKK